MKGINRSFPPARLDGLRELVDATKDGDIELDHWADKALTAVDDALDELQRLQTLVADQARRLELIEQSETQPIMVPSGQRGQ